MTITQISIWNRALGFLGTRSVASAEENTPEALQCRLYWDAARRQTLRDFPWPFAQRRAWLALRPMPTGFEHEYRFAYALPDTCLKAHEVRHEGISRRPFALAGEHGESSPLLVTDAARALLLYTEDVENCRLFDDLFAHLLSRKLAALVAVALLKNNSQKVAELEKLYTASLPMARQAAATEHSPAPLADTWITARQYQ